MMSFSEREIILSVLYALIYGVIYAFSYSLISVVASVIKTIPSVVKEIVSFEKILPTPKIKGCLNNENGKIIAFLSIILYAVGFALLSYVAVDGQIRLYMFVLSFASFYLSNFAFFSIFKAAFAFAFDVVLLVVSLCVRIAIIAFRRIKNVERKKVANKF